MIITTERLRYFVTVAEHGSFSAAARLLGVSASAVNKTIAGLEEDLEVSLFLRHHGKRPELTDDGRVLYFRGLDVLPKLLSMEQHAQSLRQGIESKLTLAVHSYSFYPKQQRMIDAFCRQFPQVALHLVDSEDLTSLDQGFDLMIGPSRLEIPRGVNLLTIDQIEWLLVCAPGFPLAKLKGVLEVADFESHTQLLMNEGFVMKAEYREALRYSSRVISVSHFYQLQQLLLNGVGFAPYPAELAKPLVKQGLLKILNFDFGPVGNTWPIDMIWTQNLGKAGLWLVEQLTEQSGRSG